MYSKPSKPFPNQQFIPPAWPTAEHWIILRLLRQMAQAPTDGAALTRSKQYTETILWLIHNLGGSRVFHMADELAKEDRQKKDDRVAKARAAKEAEKPTYTRSQTCWEELLGMKLTPRQYQALQQHELMHATFQAFKRMPVPDECAAISNDNY